jgi:hypothetical protein
MVGQGGVWPLGIVQGDEITPIRSFEEGPLPDLLNNVRGNDS